jgi:mono/diheme cytochrome c family protein
MNRALKAAGMTAGILFAIIIVFSAIIYMISQQHWNTIYNLSSESVEVSDDPAVIDHGKHVATIRGCIDCHGANLGGGIFLEDPMVGRIVATNLTTGAGGIGQGYSDEDMVRAIRKGVKKDGKPALFMPSHEYKLLHQSDMNALVSYIRSVEPVDKLLPEHKISLPMRAMYLIGGEVALFPARLIEQSLPIPVDEPATVLEKGQYLATTCIGCHGRNLSGGNIPGVPPHWPPASNLTPDGPMNTWSEADFFKVMKEGITPDGRQLQAEYMPYQIFNYMTDDELHSLFAYLKTITPFETGVRE